MKSAFVRQLIGGLVVGLVLSSIQPAYSQQPSTQTPSPVEASKTNWKVFSSPEGRFSSDFPGDPTRDTESIDTPVGKIILNKCMLQTASTYGVIYAEYPVKIDGPEVANRLLNDSAKGGANAINAELLSMTEITVDGNPGRLLQERMQDGAMMSAKMIIVGQRLYQVAVTLPSPTKTPTEQKAIYESAAARFLDSFKILASGQQTGEVDEWLAKNSSDSVHPLQKNEPEGLYDGSALNGRAVSLVKPPYPAKAREAKAQGTVEVKVLIDEKGNVIAAQAVSGDPLLHAVSVEAAKASKFLPLLIGGNPVKVTGIVQYNFVEAKP
jgi:TonB family protein